MSPLQKDIDDLQVKHLPPGSTNAALAEYFNVCLSSACGTVGDKAGDVAVYGLLKFWLAMVEAKMQAAVVTRKH